MKAIAAKMVKAMASMDAVEKGGKNEKQGYKYVRAVDVANEVRKALISNGIAFSYNVAEERMWERPTASGGMMYFCSIKVVAQFIDQDSGELLEGSAIGWGADSLDKAPYKAMTGALKYVLRMNGIIPDESDPENDAEKPSVSRVTQQLRASIEEHDEIDGFLNRDDRPQASELQSVRQIAKPLPAKAPKPSGAQITEAQGKRLFAIAMAAGWSKEDFNGILGSHGFERTNEVTKDKYEALVAEVQAK
jgi:hypothetical protein